MTDILRWDEFFRRFTDTEAAAVLSVSDPAVAKWRNMYRNKPRPCDMMEWSDIARALVRAGALSQARADLIFALRPNE